jgi:hypothetical protein
MKAALITILIAIGLAVLVAAGTWSDGRARQSVSSTPPTAHVEQHAAMTQQMRAGGPADAMQSDPMWRMMRDPVHIRAEEQYQRDLDRMLGRGTP